LLHLHHGNGSKCDQAVNTKGYDTEGNYINDQFIFYGPMLQYLVLDDFYNVYNLFLSKGNQTLLLDLKYI